MFIKVIINSNTHSNALKFYREINKKINMHSAVVLGVSSHDGIPACAGKTIFSKKSTEGTRCTA
jgi:hypothetical protein